MTQVLDSLEKVNQIKKDIHNSIKQKNSNIQDDTPFEEYSTKINEIQQEGSTVSFPQLRYDLDENGNMSIASGDLVFSGVKNVCDYGLYHAFDSNRSITSVSFPDLVSTGHSALASAFYYCLKISSVLFPNLTTIGNGGMASAFYDGSKLSSVEFPKLETVMGSGLTSAFYWCELLTIASFPNLVSIRSSGLAGCFQRCTSLTSVSFPKLVQLGFHSLDSCFEGCTSLTSISFPSLGGDDPTTNIDTNAFGSSCFSICSNLTEIHFPATSQSEIEACAGYSSKFGATNATIYFDL